MIMSLHRLLKKIAKFFALRAAKLHSWNYHALLLAFELPDEFRYRWHALELKKLGITLDKDQAEHLLSGYRWASKLQRYGAKFFLKGGVVCVQIDGLTFELHTEEEVAILHEVFIEGSYNFSVPVGKTPTVIVDIGTNVAVSACRFARRDGVAVVLGYEPFTPTYLQAIAHIEMNFLQDKVKVKNIGLSSTTRSVETTYNRDHCASVGVEGLARVPFPVEKAKMERIQLRDVRLEVSEILEAYPPENHEYVLKIDCEGAEYDIVPLLSEDLLQSTRLVMLEWHLHGPSTLVEELSRHGFSILSPSSGSGRFGMLYAFK